jgi:Isopentenyldiphosphate isomerase
MPVTRSQRQNSCGDKIIMADREENELWDLYSRDREKTGKIHRRGDSLKEGEYHLVVHICIFNSKNELLIQQRQPFKEGWPNMWDVTAAGSALQGETSQQAAEREVAEEIGLKIDLSNNRPNFTINFARGFDDYYLLEQEVDLASLHLQEEEVQAVRWVSKDEVLAMQAQGTMIPYWFLDKLFEIRDMQGAHG